jgi:hypothetical protein
VRNHQAQLGYFTFAVNTDDVDYLELAYLQALSIKCTQRNNLYAVAVDANTRAKLTDKHFKTFDYIIEFDHNSTGERAFTFEHRALELSPFKETIKLESDIVFTRSIDHWVDTWRNRDICMSYGCKDYLQQPSYTRRYRKVFDDNELPDVYNGIMYFRYSAFATKFFNTARVLFENWEAVATQGLLNCRDTTPTTDVVYALTANLVGPELCYLPAADFLNFVHMKPAVNKWQDQNWTEIVNYELDGTMLKINNANQYSPVHYYDKSFATPEVIKHYELERQRIFRSS